MTIVNGTGGVTFTGIHNVTKHSKLRVELKMLRSQVLVLTPLVASLLCSWLPGVSAQGEGHMHR